MSAAEAGKLIAPFVELSWPNDQDKIFSILDLVQEIIWKSGFFEGSTKWATVRVQSDGTVVTPHAYPILVGAKIGHQKLDIRDSYFTIHENGPLKDPDESDTFSKNVLHVGSYPTLINHIDDIKLCKKAYKIGVVAPCLPPSSVPPLTTVSAHGTDGRRIYTYRFRESNDPELIDDDKIIEYGPDDVQIEDGVLEGIIYPVTNKLITYGNVLVSEIYNITKAPTLSRVDYYLLDPEQDCCIKSGILVASLDPFETVSNYNVYRVVNRCINKGTMFGLFKKGRPEKVINETQVILSNDMNGLISIAKGVQYKFFKDQKDKGDSFIGDGLNSISQELVANNPGLINTIQIRDATKSATKRRFR